MTKLAAHPVLSGHPPPSLEGAVPLPVQCHPSRLQLCWLKHVAAIYCRPAQVPLGQGHTLIFFPNPSYYFGNLSLEDVLAARALLFDRSIRHCCFRPSLPGRLRPGPNQLRSGGVGWLPLCSPSLASAFADVALTHSLPGQGEIRETHGILLGSICKSKIHAICLPLA